MTADLEALGSALTREEKGLERRLGEARAVALQGQAAVTEITELEAKSSALDEAIEVLNSYADARQAELQSKIEEIVTSGLRTVFGNEITFAINVSHRGKLSASEFVIRTRMGAEIVETPIMDARGGGVASVAGFLLRLVILLLRKDARTVLFLDESFAQLSAEYEPALAEVVRELVDRSSAQIVLVTHSEAYSDVADVVYRLALEDGVTKIVREA